MNVAQGEQQHQPTKEEQCYAITQELKKVGADVIKSFITVKGNTQSAERETIQLVKTILDQLKYTYAEAPSQSSKDFRSINGTGLNLEVKKCDSMRIICNDTLPCADTLYIVIFTGKTYKRTPEKNIKPQIFTVMGEVFTADSPWIYDFERELNALRDKYARGENKKQLSGLMSVYPRPTYSADIQPFLELPTNIEEMDIVEEEIVVVEEEKEIVVEEEEKDDMIISDSSEGVALNLTSSP